MSLIDVTCSNGVVLKYDPTIKPGDVITAYHKGYWQVTKVVPRKNSPPIFEYTKVGKKATNSCDASYCRKVDPEALYQSLVKEAEEIRLMLQKAISDHATAELAKQAQELGMGY